MRKIVSLLASIVLGIAAAVSSVAPAEASSRCPLHYWCLFEYPNYGGLHISFSEDDWGGPFCASLASYGWQNLASSVDNLSASSHPLLLFRTSTCGGSHLTIPAGQEWSSLPTGWDNAVQAYQY